MAVSKGAAATTPIEVFYSYSHEDEELRDELEKHLSILRRQGVITGWHDRKITAGREWAGEIDQHLDTAKVILLLISADFLASDYCYDVEMTRAMERHNKGDARVIPAILRKVDWQGSPFGKLQALPTDAQAVTSWSNRDEAFTNIALGIRKAIEDLRTPATTAPNPRCNADSLPPVWNVPHQRNINFTGRKELIKDLRRVLTSGKPAALHGLGGVGKTQIAVEYAYRHAKEYDLVWWVRSETPEKLAADYELLAEQLDLKEKSERDQKIIVQAVSHALAHRTGWLLIFDNAEKPADLRGYLPQGSGGHVLITSQNPAFGSVAHPLQVKAIEPADAVKFLLKRTPLIDEKGAGDLANELGNLPLALEQAAAYIEKSGTTFLSYLKLFKTRQEDILARAEPPEGYHATVATTWELSFVEVEKQSKAAAQLMNLCAFLAPDDIPLDMLRGGTEDLPEPLSSAVADEFRWNEAVGALRRYSLVEASEDAIAMHRMVQAVVRERLGEAGVKQWIEAGAKVANTAFPSDSGDVRTWKQCARLLPHALTAAGFGEKARVAQKPTARILNQVGVYLEGRAELIAARSAFERALRIGEAVYGPDHTEVATEVNNLGRVLQDLGDLEGARKHFERALKISEAAYGPGHPTVAAWVNNLGMALYDLGDLEGAWKQYERALKIDEATYGPDHPHVAIAVASLGVVLKDLGELEGARKHFERALKIGEAAHGPDHPTVAVYANNFGSVLKDLGDLEGARKNLERALKIDEAAYGPDHPNVAIDANNLGGLLWALGDPEEARKHYQRALKIDEAAYGSDHPNVARDINNLGRVLKVLGDLEEARKHLERALKIFERALGKDHPSTRTARRNLELLGQ